MRLILDSIWHFSNINISNVIYYKIIRFFHTEYETIYRSILKFIYWPIYVSLILTDIGNFFKNHISTDICRNFSFFDRYKKIFKKRFWAYIDRNFGQFTYISQYTLISTDICFHIPIIYYFIYPALYDHYIYRSI